MVDWKFLEKKILLKAREMEQFFLNVKESSVHDADISSAQLGLDSVRNIKKNLDVYRKSSKNITLKKIHAGFSTLVRGVEGFSDYETELKFRKAGNGIYDLHKELESHIKW